MASKFHQRVLLQLCDVKPSETAITLASFSLAFIIMGAYYIMRPLRDAMASDWSDAAVATLWSINFFLSALAVLAYGAMASRIATQRLVPCVYSVFVASFAGFYLGGLLVADNIWLEQAFYVWLSVFALFHISVFWSLMADSFDQAQAKRLFAFIGAGASVGALVGPALAATLASLAGSDQLMIIAAALLALAVPTTLWVQQLRSANPTLVSASANPLSSLGGRPFAGFYDFFRSPYLLAIGVFIFLYTVVSSFVYFELKNLLADYSRDQRTQIWAMMDLVVNTATLLVAAFITGRVTRAFGVTTTLTSIPVIIGAGLLVLAAAPAVSVVIAVQVVRRIGNYAVTRPAREMLFTAVDRQARYKAKPVIDIVIYRGGDMIAGWIFTGLILALELNLAAMAAIGALVALAWAGVALYLGRSFAQQAQIL